RERARSKRGGGGLPSSACRPASARSRASSRAARDRSSTSASRCSATRGCCCLDEPYQGFDRGAYASFWDHVAGWRAQRRAIVVVTHFLADSALVDRVIELAVRP